MFFLFAIVFLTVYFPLLLSLSNPGELCGDTSIDAIFTNSKGENFVFLGSKFWKISNNIIAPGYPRSISDFWPGVPNDIDAVLVYHYKNKKRIRFFKENKYWAFTEWMNGNVSPLTNNSYDVSVFGLPESGVDAAVLWGKDNQVYFFNGSKDWKWNQYSLETQSGNITDLWKGVPDNIEAATRWTNGKTYLFKSGKYWRLNDETGAVDEANPPYPRDAGKWWFGCPTPSLSTKKEEEEVNEYQF